MTEPDQEARQAPGTPVSRKKKFARIVLEMSFFVALFLGVSAYQARDLLPTDRSPAPALSAQTLGQEIYDLNDVQGRPVLIYFFAPWCPYCSASADNLVRLRKLRDNDALEILVVALDWESRQEIVEYAADHELNMPVLLGDRGVADAWRIRGFPTYYVLDREHRVISRDFGYSTQLGLWWRSWLAS